MKNKLGLTLGALFLAPVIASATDGARVTYDKGTKIEIPSAGFDLRLNTEIATYYSYSAGNKGYLEKNSFDVNRADFVATGNVANKAFTYNLRYAFNESENLNAISPILEELRVEPYSNSSFLKEAWVQWNASENTYVRLGRQNFQFGLQNAMDENGYLFATRALPFSVNHYPTRDDGIVASTSFKSGECDALTLVGGVFNGYGNTYAVNDPFEKSTDVIGHLAVNYIGNGYDRSYEGDYYQTRNLAWTLGLSGSYGKLENPYYGEEAYEIGLDFGAKKSGFSIQSEVTWHAQQAEPIDQYLGYYLQTSFFVIPEKVELGLRYAGFYYDRSIYQDYVNNKFNHEGSIVANVYLAGPALKWQTGFSYYRLSGHHDLQIDSNPIKDRDSGNQYKAFTGFVGNF